MTLGVDVFEVQRLVDCNIAANKFQRHADMFYLRMLTRIFNPFDAEFIVFVDGDQLPIARLTSAASGLKFCIKSLQPFSLTNAFI